MAKRSGFAPYFEALRIYADRGIIDSKTFVKTESFKAMVWYDNVYFEKTVAGRIELTCEDISAGVIRQITLPIKPHFEAVPRRGLFRTFRLSKRGIFGFSKIEFTVSNGER